MKQKESFLSDQCKEVILGTLLGDGSLKINRNYKNARLSFRHSIIQKEYFFWKVNLLQSVCSSKFFWEQPAEKEVKGNSKLRFQSAALPELTEIYRFTTKRGKLNVSRKWLNKLTPLSLAIWWMDDGSLVVNSRRGVFCTDSFSCEEHKVIARYFQVVWKIKTQIGSHYDKQTDKNFHRLWIRSTEELKKFLLIILPFIKVEQMLPKVLLLYKDSELQQRWISEVESATNFSRETIEKYVKEKKARWKSFRE